MRRIYDTTDFNIIESILVAMIQYSIHLDAVLLGDFYQCVTIFYKTCKCTNKHFLLL